MKKLTFEKLTKVMGEKYGLMTRDEKDDLLNEIEKSIDDEKFNFIWETGLSELHVWVEEDQYTFEDITTYTAEELEKAYKIMQHEGLTVYKFKQKNIDIANYEFD